MTPNRYSRRSAIQAPATPPMLAMRLTWMAFDQPRVARVIAGNRYQEIDRHRGDDEQRTFAGASRQRTSQQVQESRLLSYGLRPRFQSCFEISNPTQ